MVQPHGRRSGRCRRSPSSGERLGAVQPADHVRQARHRPVRSGTDRQAADDRGVDRRRARGHGRGRVDASSAGHEHRWRDHVARLRGRLSRIALSALVIVDGFARFLAAPDYPIGGTVEETWTRRSKTIEASHGRALMLDLFAPSTGRRSETCANRSARYERQSASPGSAAGHAFALIYESRRPRRPRRRSGSRPSSCITRRAHAPSAGPRPIHRRPHPGRHATSSCRARQPDLGRRPGRHRGRDPGIRDRRAASRWSRRACSRPSSSPTSSTRPSARRRSATAAGGSCSRSTIASSRGELARGTAAMRSRRPVTASSRRSTDRHGRSARALAIRDALRSIGVDDPRGDPHRRDRAAAATTSRGSACTSAPASRRSPDAGEVLVSIDGQGSRRGLRHRLRRPRQPHVEGDPGRLARVRGPGLSPMQVSPRAAARLSYVAAFGAVGAWYPYLGGLLPGSRTRPRADRPDDRARCSRRARVGPDLGRARGSVRRLAARHPGRGARHRGRCHRARAVRQRRREWRPHSC